MSSLSSSPLNRSAGSTLASRTVVARRIAAVCGTGVLLLGAAACGSDNGGATNAAAPSGGSTGGAPTNQQGQQAGQLPGANGKVAAVSGSTAQVQSTDGQVAVSWTSSTAFTKQVSAKLSDVEVGDCVTVTSADASATTAPSAGSTPTPATEVAAGSVRITAATNGTCLPGGGAGRGPGGQNGGAPQGAPEGAPQGLPEGGAEGGTPPTNGGQNGGRGQFRGGFGGGTFGTVKAVSSTGFTVTSSFPGAPNGGTATTTEVAVTVSSKTTYTTTAKGAASDVKVGTCLRADGKADDTGAVTATRVQLTPAVDGECTTTFARFGGRRTGGNGGTGAGTAQAS